MKVFKLFSCLSCILLLLLCSCSRLPSDPDLSGLEKLEGQDLVNGLVKWEGRYKYDEAAREVAVYFTATGFTVDFYGTGLEAEFTHNGADIYYNVAVDGETLPTKKQVCLPSGESSTKVVLAGGLEKGRHTVTCLKVDEPRDGYTAVKALTTDGAFYYRDAETDEARLKFMFVCASGGSGFGSLYYSTSATGGVAAASRTCANSSSLFSFNFLAARMFDADVQFVAQAGWGVTYPHSIFEVIDAVGITSDNNEKSALETGVWDCSGYDPQVIIFNIGGNDTTANGFDMATYKKDVVSLVSKLHGQYPDAVMLWTHTNSNAGSYAISALTTAGIMREGYIKQCVIPKVGSDGTWGASNHNSLLTHITSAQIIADTLEAEFGLSHVIPNIDFHDYEDMLSL